MIPRRPLGNTGLQVSILGYGGAPIGFTPGRSGAEFVVLLRRALELGINFFDTAPDYRESEELLGEALRGRRTDAILATKCGRLQARRGRTWEIHEDWSATGVLRTLDASLRRLQTDYLDLVQLHSPPGWVLEHGDALHALTRAREAGKVRHVGISADGDDAWRALEKGAFATLQISYSILQQEPGMALLPAAVRHGMGLIAKQPIANGIPNQRERPTHPDWAWKWDLAQRLNWQGDGPGADRISLALRWVLANPLVSTAIVGTTSIAHLEANVVAATQPLDPTTVDRIHEAYERARRQMQAE